MRNYFLLGCLFFCSFLQENLWAQSSQFNLQQPPVLPQAPNSASLGKFGDYQVSFFSGLPQISIPLYTIKTSGFEVPLSLSYHASGLKVHEYPSWVGLGWALNAGGQIRRSLVGTVDEFGYLGGDTLKAQDINPHYTADRPYLEDLNKGVRDLGADIFSYSFPGGDGKFFFDRDNNFQPAILPYAPIKITYPGAFQQLNFDISDANGNRYQFGKTYAEFTRSGTVDGSNFSEPTSAWMLEKMISSNKADTISFTYQHQFDRMPLERNDTWVVNDMIEPGNNTMVDPYSPNVGAHESSFSFSEMYSYNNQEIHFKNGKIVFELDTENRHDFDQINISKALKRIKVYSTGHGVQKLIKTITLFHTKGYRLNLDSIQILDANSIVVNTYKFDYNTTISLPTIDGEMIAKDYWGYYNGKHKNLSNLTLIPKTQITYQPFPHSTPTRVTIGSQTDNSREPDSVYMQAQILKRIYFPTKGYTDFAYETNRYRDEQNNLKLAGGLRVKSIKSYDGPTSTPVTKTYKYGFDESGAGRPNFFRGTQFFFDEQHVEYWARFDDEESPLESNAPYLASEKRRRIYYSNPTIDIHTLDGTPVVYPFVTEYSGEGTNVLGKTVYQFRDSMDNIVQVSNSSKAHIISRFFERGQLLNKKVFKLNSTGNFQKISEEKLTYNTDNFTNSIKLAGLILKEKIVRENISDYSLSFTGFDWDMNNNVIQNNDNYLTSTTAITYDEIDTTQFVKTITTLGYGSFRHQQPINVTTINSKNEVLTTTTKFPADYLAGNNNVTGNPVVDSMLAKHMHGVAIEKWATLTKPTESAKVIGGQINLFKRLSGGLIVEESQSKLMVASPLPDFMPAVINSGSMQTDNRYETGINYNLFDSRGNLLEVQKTNDIKESYVWAYGGAYPIAKIVGAAYNSVKQFIDTALLYHPATTDLQIKTQLTTLRNALNDPTVFLSTYTYKPLVGMTSETDPSGRTTFYEYDAFGRLSLVRDHNNNILQKYCYNYAGEVENCAGYCEVTTATWENTLTALRCKTGSGIYTGEQEQEQKDMNPCSATYQALRWIVVGTDCISCPKPQIWQTTGNYRCVQDANGNTGYQEKEERNIENCSVNFNAFRWVANGYNTSACPLYGTCNTSNCTGQGPQYKCVNGLCEEGFKVYTSSYYDAVKGYVCVYHYEWSDATWSTDFEESNSSGYACVI